MATSLPQPARSASALNPPPTLSTQHPAFGDSLRRRRRSSHSSHSSHGSDSSHSSHSSYAARHPDRVPQKAASPNKAFLSVIGLLALVLVYTIVGVWLFVKGFLLTRHELTRINECSKPADRHWTLPSPPATMDDAAVLSWAAEVLDPTTGKGECRLAPTHNKAVVLIVDALRYDFVAPPPPAGTATKESGWKPNCHYHNILTLPAELTAQHGIPAFADKPGPASFLAHFTADPPTTTLQRLKGLTTGTLPTFFEAGANFGSAGTGVGQVNEDNWIAQFKRSILSSSPSSATGAGLVFAGDDTWSTVFPDLFDADTTWTYDSFNVEDLDTVDRGVEARLLPFLQRHHPERMAGVHDSWRLLVGHTLGVDHVGHRFGASHAKMKVKLHEMQIFLQNITDAVDDETLLVVMGDHGMDERGDHGGDAELEIGAALWMYSKAGLGYTGRRQDLRLDPAAYLSTAHAEAVSPARIPFSPLPSPPYANHRSVPQIDLVPTISTLLGLPVPYNNLGSVVPDVFAHPHTLLRALRITATQMRTYLTAYAAHSPDLAAFQPEFDARWLDAVRADAELARLLHAAKVGGDEVEAAVRRAAQAYHAFNRVSLGRAREVWAQFDMVRIVVGLAVLVLALVSAWVVRGGAVDGLIAVLPAGDEAERRTETTHELFSVVWKCVSTPALAGAAVGTGVHYTTLLPLPGVIAAILQPLTLLDSVLAGATLLSQLALVSTHLAPLLRSSAQDSHTSVPATTTLLNTAGWLVLLLHAALFASNSFLVFEDRFVLLALTSLLFVRGVLLVGASPSTRAKLRAGVLCTLALVAVRLAAIPRVCREEQAPFCESTFFASSPNGGAALNSPYTIGAAYALAYVLPSIVARFLQHSRSNVGVARAFGTWVLRPVLMSGAGFWALDWASPLERVQRAGWSAALERIKMWTVKADLVVLGIAAVGWVFAPLCLEIRREGGGEEEGEGQQPKVTILGYANSLGSSFALLVATAVGVLWVVTQPAGQLGLGMVWVAALACVELGDAERDLVVLHRQRAAPSSTPPSNPPHLTSTELTTYTLLGHLAFFATGHQATLPTIQWRLAFLTSPTLTYPTSPLLVALNTFGHLTALPALLATLGVLWNATPQPRGSGRSMRTPRQLLAALMAVSVYALALLCATAVVSGVLFRRHLMLFKVWTPRVMLAGAGAVLGQMAGVGAAAAAWQTANKVNRLFGSEFA
ncbi:related to GPI13-protein involved in glycosylphosphatidylinositol biosynthesis [Sporisorium reilianum SRZ2]|uniref:Related to GPI13-protein involved in glycosylphosphatidylinositol biosynthesis n=1 Tax=Sporisorium reilianum (strain SRZ2) TaxID=999809 RepID=E7A2U7_SPORE|nr:related to GPI13-protein involved in glycosylphosphatidylinositol biosynthesis [Sporisorium reilianum SRZ2]